MADWKIKLFATHQTLEGIGFNGRGEDLDRAECALADDIIQFAKDYGDDSDVSKLIFALYSSSDSISEVLRGVGFTITQTTKARKCYG